MKTAGDLKCSAAKEGRSRLTNTHGFHIPRGIKAADASIFGGRKRERTSWWLIC
jgi:hypothetical protein